MQVDGDYLGHVHAFFDDYNYKVETRDLMSGYPPRFYDDRKKLVYDIALSFNSDTNPDIFISRWKTMDLLPMFPLENTATEYLMREDTFQYDNEFGKKPGHIEWHLNFADGDLFFGYGGSLMAQDELQVAEHPALASVREMLLDLSMKDSAFEPCTRDIDGKPTPYLIGGVERRLSIAIDANAAEGRPEGLYGNKFRIASADAIRRACKLIIPPTITNLIAVEAPSGGRGEYTLAQITDIFVTAFTAFMAAKYTESYMMQMEALLRERYNNPDAEFIYPVVTIHTGNWGTGAYGGNKVIMALLQLAAARAADIDRLVYHTFSSEYSKAYRQALYLLNNKFIPSNSSITTESFLKQVEDLKLRWSVSDGN